MGNIVAFLSISLDGVMQAPGHPDEDRRGGFDRGGWAAPYADEMTMGLAAEGSTTTVGLLFGRHTYERFHAVWAGRRDNPFSEILDNTTKFVASRTRTEPLPWANSVLLAGEAAETVPPLRARTDGDLVILGSGELVRTLVAADAVDRLVLLIHPIVVGDGRRLFAERGDIRTFALTSARTNTRGVIVAMYERSRS